VFAAPLELGQALTQARTVLRRAFVMVGVCAVLQRPVSDVLRTADGLRQKAALPLRGKYVVCVGHVLHRVIVQPVVLRFQFAALKRSPKREGVHVYPA
jgi:hypothetical protein